MQQESSTRPARAGVSRRLAPRVVSVATAVPPHRVPQSEAKGFAERIFGRALARAEMRLLEVFDNAGIEGRSVCMPLEWYGAPHDFGATNALYIKHATRLAREAAERALARAGLTAGQIDHVILVSTTGIATPSLDARLAGPLGLRADVRRTPIWGLGCAGGAAGLSRARDLALAHPDSRVLLIAVELCSLTFQHGDMDRRNLVATSLFADGAGAAVIAGARAGGTPASRNGDAPPGIPASNQLPQPVSFELVDSHSVLWPDSLGVMGWDVDAHGLHVVFSRDIPTIVNEQVQPSLAAFLAGHSLAVADIRHMIAHPGGPRVLAAYASALGLAPEAFRHSRDVLRDHGNMSSPTCLFVLERTLAAGGVAAGDLGLVSALGPGFSAEYVLVRATA